MNPFEEVFVWRLAGATTWHSAIIFAFHAIVLLFTRGIGASLSLLFSFSSIILNLLLLALHAAVLYSQRGLLTPSDVSPAVLPKLRIKSKSVLSLFISRVVQRNGSMQDKVAILKLFAASAACSTIHTYIYSSRLFASSKAPSLGWSCLMGTLAGLTYTVVFLMRRDNLLSFPAAQLHRYYRITRQLPQAVTPYIPIAASIPFASLLLAATYLPSYLPSYLQLLSSSLTCTLCMLCWAAGGLVLRVVFTERLSMVSAGDSQSVVTIMAGLKHKDIIVQALAYQDLARLCEDTSRQGVDFRASIFQDETGRQTWVPLVSRLVLEVAAFLPKVAPVIPGLLVSTPAVPLSAPSTAYQPWSTAQRAVVAGPPKLSAQEVDAVPYLISAQHFRVSCCIRALAGLTAAAYFEDRYGQLLLCSPGLPDVLQLLLGSAHVMQAYVKIRALEVFSSVPPPTVLGFPLLPTPEVETSAVSLEDISNTAVYRVVDVFGSKLKAVDFGASATKLPLKIDFAKALCTALAYQL